MSPIDWFFASVLLWNIGSHRTWPTAPSRKSETLLKDVSPGATSDA
jgi:hypothetical protein